MSDKSIELNQGGTWEFRVTKVLKEGDSVERFSVTIDPDGYRGGRAIAEELTWAEASAAMNRFRDEFEAAFEALVQISTLQPSGLHEEE